MSEPGFDPTRPTPDKLRVQQPEASAPDAPDAKTRIAEKVRADSKERGAVTTEHAIRQVLPGFRREQVSAVLAEMDGDGRYGDIKAVVAPSGRLYLFSEAHIIALEAQEKGRLEEAKHAIADKIRADSRRVVLTPAADLAPLFPMPEPEQQAAFLAEILADERFGDIRALTGPKGEVCYHCDAFLSGNYASIMVRAQAKDPCLAIAEAVRDRARVLPRPTRITTFEDPVFGVDFGNIEALVAELLARPEYADIKKMVHPVTGGVYLSSTRWLEEQQAFHLMDWDEVLAAQNP